MYFSLPLVFFLQWKASGDIVYNRPVAAVRGSSDAGPSTHARFYKPICSQLPARDDEVPRTRGFMARQMFDNRSSYKQTLLAAKNTRRLMSFF